MPSQATDSFSIDWFTIDGGSSSMNGGNFTLEGTTGQADTGLFTLVTGEQFLKSGFWALNFTTSSGAIPTLRARQNGPSMLLSWYPDTPGFSLQQSTTLLPDSWSTLSPELTNPATIQIAQPRLFFRLFKP